jgi:hypothetical protein
MKCASEMLTNAQVKILKTATKTAIKSNEVGIEFRLPSARSFARVCRLLGENFFRGWRECEWRLEMDPKGVMAITASVTNS